MAQTSEHSQDDSTFFSERDHTAEPTETERTLDHLTMLRILPHSLWTPSEIAELERCITSGDPEALKEAKRIVGRQAHLYAVSGDRPPKSPSIMVVDLLPRQPDLTKLSETENFLNLSRGGLLTLAEEAAVQRWKSNRPRDLAPLPPVPEHFDGELIDNGLLNIRYGTLDPDEVRPPHSAHNGHPQIPQQSSPYAGKHRAK